MIALLIVLITATGVALGGAAGGGGGSSSSTSTTTTSEIIYDTNYEPDNSLYYITNEYNAQYGLAEIHAAQAYATLASNDKNVAGDGVKIAITDTGVLLSHQEISANDSGLSYDFNNDSSTVTDTNGHGTHVASIAMGAKDGKGMHGVAYDAKVVAISMLDGASVAGISYASKSVENGGAGADVINMSWGVVDAEDNGKQYTIGSGQYYVELASLIDEFNVAKANDVVLVAATGNDGYTDYVSAPALFAQDDNLFLDAEDNTTGIMIAVASVDSDGTISSFSNQCKQAASYCLAAPGGFNGSKGVYAAYIGSNSTYEELVGTSMATPHVTGAVAVLRGAWPTLTADQVVQILLRTANDEGIYANSDIYGHGLLDLQAAVQLIGVPSLASGTSVSSAGYDVSKTSLNTDPIFGDAFSTNVASQLKSAVFFDDFGRDFKANLANTISRTSSYNIPSLDNLAFNNTNTQTIPLNFGKDGNMQFKFQVNSYKTQETNSNRIAPTYSQNRYGLKFLMTDHSQQDRFLNKSEGFSFTQNLNNDFKAGFSFNSNEIANVKGQTLANPGFISVSNFANSPYQSFVTGTYMEDSATQRNYNQIFASQRVLDNRFSLNFLHQNSYETDSNIGNISNRQNQISDFSVTYLPGSKSNISFSFGRLNEFDNNFLNSKALGAFETAGDVKTSYFKIATTKEIMKNIYLVSSFSEGITKANGNNIGIIRGYNDIRSRSSSLGLINEDMLGGTVGFIYSEPLRVYKGSASINVPVGLDSQGNAIRYQADVSLTPLGKEQDFEMFYSKDLRNNAKMKLNFVLQKEAGNIRDINNNYLGFVTYNKKF